MKILHVDADYSQRMVFGIVAEQLGHLMSSMQEPLHQKPTQFAQYAAETKFAALVLDRESFAYQGHDVPKDRRETQLLPYLEALTEIYRGVIVVTTTMNDEIVRDEKVRFPQVSWKHKPLNYQLLLEELASQRS